MFSNHTISNLVFFVHQNDEQEDEKISSYFTLSFFRRDMLQLAIDEYPSEYAIEKKVIGEHSRLYVQKSWSKNAWTELPDTASFIHMLEDQMAQPKRVNQRKELSIKLSFDRSKSGFEFEDGAEFQNYIGLDGDAID